MEISSQFQGPALLSFGKQPSVPNESEVGWNPVCLERIENLKSLMSLPRKETRYLDPILCIVNKSLCLVKLC